MTQKKTTVQACASICGDDQSASRPGVRVPPFIARRRHGMNGQWPLQDFLELGALVSAVPCARLHARHVLREWGLARLGDGTELLVGRCAMRAPRLTSRCPGFRCSGQPHPRAGSGGGPSGPSRSRQTSPDPHPSAAGKRQVRSGGPVLAWRSGCSDMSPAWRAGSALRRTGPCRNG